MRLDGVEHWDHFQDETIYWLDLSDMPEPIQRRQGELMERHTMIEALVYVLSIIWPQMSMPLLPKAELLRRWIGNIFYVDNDGDKHWFQGRSARYAR